MKTLLTLIAVSALSASVANAGSIYNGVDAGNSDLYSGDNAMFSLAVQPGTGDTYGGSPFNNTHLQGLIDSQSNAASVDVYNGAVDGNPDFQ